VSAEARPGDGFYEAIMATKDGGAPPPPAAAGAEPGAVEPAVAEGPELGPEDGIDLKGTPGDAFRHPRDGGEDVEFQNLTQEQQENIATGPTFDAGTTVIRSDLARVPGQDALEFQQRKAEGDARRLIGDAGGPGVGGGVSEGPDRGGQGAVERAAEGREGAARTEAAQATVKAAGQTAVAEFEKAHGRLPRDMNELMRYFRTGQVQGEVTS